MKPPRWLSEDTILILHSASLARFGGAEGVRDYGLFQSALVHPVNLFNYEKTSDLADLAAAYAFALIKNHAFVDGNKRVAFLACGVFLDMNEKTLNASPSDAIAAVMALADGTLTEQAFANWIRRNWQSLIPKNP
jgi:death-on-curing protein